jgi:hypothetical protein
MHLMVLRRFILYSLKFFLVGALPEGIMVTHLETIFFASAGMSVRVGVGVEHFEI